MLSGVRGDAWSAAGQAMAGLGADPFEPFFEGCLFVIGVENRVAVSDTMRIELDPPCLPPLQQEHIIFMDLDEIGNGSGNSGVELVLMHMFVTDSWHTHLRATGQRQLIVA
ncbi:MAG: hypothetical protein A2075_17145 [Geobacteraceae bacterium GWC2_58_44]|nr:MAG: hypothetical protein A2075_17145 [Geobacteraceae bacterium GWC2_58_44]